MVIAQVRTEGIAQLESSAPSHRAERESKDG